MAGLPARTATALWQNDLLMETTVRHLLMLLSLNTVDDAVTEKTMEAL